MKRYSGTDKLKKIVDCQSISNNADIIEVVRCKDCRFSSDPSDGEVFCEIFESCMPEKGFCSCGKRKDEE